jgi:hypothetical protein
MGKLIQWHVPSRVKPRKYVPIAAREGWGRVLMFRTPPPRVGDFKVEALATPQLNGLACRALGHVD